MIKKYGKVLLNIIIPLLGIYIVCFWGPKILHFFLPFVIGWIIAMIANPLVRFLESKVRIVRKHSSVLIIVVVLGTIIGLFYLLIIKVAGEISAFTGDLPELYRRASLEWRTFLMQFDHILEKLPASVKVSFMQFTDNIGDTFSTLVQKMASPTVTVAGNMAKSIPSVLVYSIITILSSYFFIAEREKIVTVAKKYVPETCKTYYRLLKQDMKHLIAGYFLAQFKIMGVIAAVLLIGFLVLGVHYAVVFAVLIAILDFLPLFGTGTILFPWAILRLVSGDYAFAAGLIFIYILTQVIRRLIEPKIIGDSFGLSPLATLFLLYLGFKVSGLAGMILAVPIGLLAWNLYRHGLFDSLIKNVRILIHDMNKFRNS